MTNNMKIKILKLSTVLLILTFISVGCQKEDDIFELHIGDENAVIEKKVDGIEFKFCLINEQGEPATVFSEGEKFTFQFSIKNFRENPLPFYDYGYLEQADFFSVSSSEKSYGQPFLFIGYSNTLELRWLLDEEYLSNSNLPSYEISVPWQDDRENWQLRWGVFEGLNKELLDKGSYYTQFSYQFTFGDRNKEPELKTDLLTFKINFEIK